MSRFASIHRESESSYSRKLEREVEAIKDH
jgi:hypothetical protein